MRLQINGDAAEYADALSLAELISVLEMPAERVAAMVNGQVIARDRREAHALSDGDTVELLTFAGGG